MTTLLATVMSALVLFSSGCTQQNELEQSRKRIAELEKALASLSAKENSQTAPKQTDPKSGEKPKSGTESSPAPSGEQWSYRTSDEKMTGKTAYFASVNSTNTVSFRSPYNGTQNGRLVLRNSPAHGKSVMLSIDRGQILCRSYEVCEVLVRFDEGKPETFAGIGPSDNSTETVFIRNYEKFFGKLRKSKIVRISVDIYQEGSPVFKFDTSGFSQEKYAPKK